MKKPEEMKQPPPPRNPPKKQKELEAGKPRETDGTSSDSENPEWWRNEGGGPGELH